jgi:chromate transporter
VIANLGLFFAYHVFLPRGFSGPISWVSILICALAGIALFKFQKSVLAVLGGAALAGLLFHYIAVLMG